MAGRPTKKLPLRGQASTNRPQQPETEPETTETETPIEDQAQQPHPLDVERREQENEATKGNATKSMLTDTTYEDVDFASLPNAPRDAIVLGPHENLVVDGELSQDKTTLKLNKAVYRAFLPMGSKRWAFLLEYPQGAELPASMVIPADQKHPASPTTPAETEQEGEENDDNDSSGDDEKE